MAGGDGLGAENSCARPNLLPARAIDSYPQDPSAPSPLEDEAVQRSCRRLFRLGAREKAVASRGDGARVGAAKRGVSCKKAHHGEGKKMPLYMPLVPSSRKK